MEDFNQTYPTATQEELDRFRVQYKRMLNGKYKQENMFEDNNNSFDTEELETRLFILARVVEQYNTLPMEKVKEIDERIQTLKSKSLVGTITEDERWELKAL